jgi:hypothetical protein
MKKTTPKQKDSVCSQKNLHSRRSRICGWSSKNSTGTILLENVTEKMLVYESHKQNMKKKKVSFGSQGHFNYNHAPLMHGYPPKYIYENIKQFYICLSKP